MQRDLRQSYAAPLRLIMESMHAGTQHNARRVTSARPVFGEETRAGRDKRFMDEELEKAACAGRNTPSPHAYEIQEYLGKQPLSTKRRSDTVRFGTARRFGSGPDGGIGMVYNASPSALGTQVYSRKKTLPSFGFGTSTRDGARKVRLCCLQTQACAAPRPAALGCAQCKR